MDNSNYFITNDTTTEHGTTPATRASRSRARASGTSGRVQHPTRGHVVALQELDGAARERIIGLQSQMAADIGSQEQRAGARRVMAYLPSEDQLLEVLRLEGFMYRQIQRVRPIHTPVDLKITLANICIFTILAIHDNTDSGLPRQ